MTMSEIHKSESYKAHTQYRKPFWKQKIIRITLDMFNDLFFK